jgi:hypothetical protein
MVMGKSVNGNLTRLHSIDNRLLNYPSTRERYSLFKENP